MYQFICLWLFVFIAVVGLSKDTTGICFHKKDSERTLEFKLPLKCRLYETRKNKRVGEILAFTDSTVFFEFKAYDTALVNLILAMDDLSRKEKYDRIDSIIEESKTISELNQDSLYKIRILSGSDNLGREMALLGSSVLFMGSLGALLYELSTSVGSSAQWWYWLEAAGITGGAAGVAVLMKRDIYFSKWRLKKRAQS